MLHTRSMIASRSWMTSIVKSKREGAKRLNAKTQRRKDKIYKWVSEVRFCERRVGDGRFGFVCPALRKYEI